jgi:hypothetical protein
MAATTTTTNSNKMMLIARTFSICLVALWMQQCSAFSVAPKISSCPSTTTTTSLLWRATRQPQRLLPLLQQTPDDANADKKDTADKKENADNKENAENKAKFPNTSYLDSLEKDKASGSLMRTLLLAVPLFCKFVIVLMIKFLTDLVVYPLLFLYRLARLTKRRILALFKKDDGAVNGSS